MCEQHVLELNLMDPWRIAQDMRQESKKHEQAHPLPWTYGGKNRGEQIRQQKRTQFHEDWVWIREERAQEERGEILSKGIEGGDTSYGLQNMRGDKMKAMEIILALWVVGQGCTDVSVALWVVDQD